MRLAKVVLGASFLCSACASGQPPPGQSVDNRTILVTLDKTCDPSAVRVEGPCKVAGVNPTALYTNVDVQITGPEGSVCVVSEKGASEPPVTVTLEITGDGYLVPSSVALEFHCPK